MGYELDQRRLPPLILRIVGSVICKGFLRHELGCMEGDEEDVFSRWRVFSLTELTDLTDPFNQRFELTERLRHTDITEAFQLTLAVTFCEIG